MASTGDADFVVVVEGEAAAVVDRPCPVADTFFALAPHFQYSREVGARMGQVSRSPLVGPTASATPPWGGQAEPLRAQAAALGSGAPQAAS